MRVPEVPTRTPFEVEVIKVDGVKYYRATNWVKVTDTVATQCAPVNLSETRYFWHVEAANNANGIVGENLHRALFRKYTGKNPKGLTVNHINHVVSDMRACNLEALSEEAHEKETEAHRDARCNVPVADPGIELAQIKIKVSEAEAMKVKRAMALADL
jgi:hypothetical protein